MSVPNPMPSACAPIRLISFSNSHRASYSRNPVALTMGSDSKAYVLGERAGFGAGNIGTSDWHCGAKHIAHRPPGRKAFGIRVHREGPPSAYSVKYEVAWRLWCGRVGLSRHLDHFAPCVKTRGRRPSQACDSM